MASNGDEERIADEVRLAFIRALRDNEEIAAWLSLHDVTGETMLGVRGRLDSNPASLERNVELKYAIEKVVAIVLKSRFSSASRGSAISSSGFSSSRSSVTICGSDIPDEETTTQLPPGIQELVEKVGAAAVTSRRSMRNPNRTRQHVADPTLDCVHEEQNMPNDGKKP